MKKRKRVNHSLSIYPPTSALRRLPLRCDPSLRAQLAVASGQSWLANSISPCGCFPRLPTPPVSSPCTPAREERGTATPVKSEAHPSIPAECVALCPIRAWSLAQEFLG